jgi:hypothetical protein
MWASENGSRSDMKRFLIALFFYIPVVAWAGDRPISSLTPGRADPIMTAAKLCAKGFTTKSIRDVTEEEKQQVYQRYHMQDHVGVCGGKEGCEIDHLISLEIGGSNDIENLWPQSYSTKPWNAHVKDKLEDRLHALMCRKKIAMKAAQDCIRKDWIACYRKYFGTARR